METVRDLSDREKGDHLVSRNLEEWYWDQVRAGNINFPVLPGQWIAVETVEKPTYGTKYARTPFAERLGSTDDRFGITWNGANQAIQREKQKILVDIGLPRGADLRLLDAPGWNLLANREGWGKTNTYEWANTEYRRSGGSGRLLVGDSGGGGAARVDWSHPGGSVGYVGFRAAVVLSSPKRKWPALKRAGLIFRRKKI